MSTDRSSLNNSPNRQAVSPFTKFLLEMGPLGVFFFFNYKGEWFIKNLSLFSTFEKPIFLATACFLITSLVSFVISWQLTKTMPLMPLITAVFVFVFGGLTLWFHNETFIKVKPTIVNILFGSSLLIGLYFKRPFLLYLMGSALNLQAEGWHKLTIRFAFFFFILAILNEIVWRNFSTEFWASFKVFGTTILTFLFLALQMPLITKYTIQEGGSTQNNEDQL